jgi:hypothetical protein
VSRRRAAALLLVVAFGVAACSSGDGTGAAPAGTPAEPRTWPLTGLPVADGAEPRPVLVVKVDNTSSAEPQIGMDAADVVVEQLVEGGLTRLAVMLHSALPAAVEPVRSLRATDIGLVAPTGGVLVASGGAGAVVRQAEAAGVRLWQLGDEGLARDPARRAPYNVVLEPAAALAAIAAEPDPPQPPVQELLPFGAAPSTGDAEAPVTTAELRFSGTTTVRWTWTEGDGWVRAGDLAGPAFVPDSLLVLRVPVEDAGYLDPGGNPVPTTVTEGTGEGVLLHDGRAVELTWTKPAPDDPWSLTAPDDAGTAVTVPPGRTYVALVPNDGGAVTLR